MPDCRHLKKGDKCIRNLAGIPMLGYVMEVEEKVLKFASYDTMHWPIDELWTFDRETGAEEDEVLEWGVRFGRTGSVLILKEWTDEDLETVKLVKSLKGRK